MAGTRTMTPTTMGTQAPPTNINAAQTNGGVGVSVDPTTGEVFQSSCYKKEGCNMSYVRVGVHPDANSNARKIKLATINRILFLEKKEKTKNKESEHT